MGQGQEHVDAAVPGGAVSGACLFAVADQPGFSVLSLEKLLDFWQAHSYGIVAAGTAVADAKHDSSVELKNPVIFSSAYYQELLSIIGDAGGKQVIRRHMEDTGICRLPAAELEDLEDRKSVV